ncbi:sugar phosphate isomerase/epimerase family protein [Streptomyces sp. NPDC013187]|uniref:sugar phosphate isomerase/epimerase family protein n=1 Tax=Streptomyces sp. NPDC013187 TaxID=3364865 RepID=UPI0036C27BBB
MTAHQGHGPGTHPAGSGAGAAATEARPVVTADAGPVRPETVPRQEPHPARAEPLRFAYGTNGFADHRLTDALAVLADLGYDGVSLTLDHQHLDPYAPDLAARVRDAGRAIRRAGLAVVVETGARYLLDPMRKHRPTLLSAEPEGRAARQELLRRAIVVGAELGAEAVHFWSGTPDPGTTRDEAWRRLEEGCATALADAERAGVRLAFEPEPGMLVADLAGYRRLWRALGAPDRLGLTLDIGHCRCLEPYPEPRCVELAADSLAHVQIEDMRRGVHEHLPFGAGEIDFPPVLDALRAARYRGLVSVELPRHSHAATVTARHSIEFLRAAEARTAAPASRTAAPATRTGPPAPASGTAVPASRTASRIAAPASRTRTAAPPPRTPRAPAHLSKEVTPT